jgi:hypothetical protein
MAHRICLGAIGFVLVLAAGRPAGADGEPAREENELDARAFNLRVEAAVDAGVDWLKRQISVQDEHIFGAVPQQPTYSDAPQHRHHVARTAFPVQALCKSGVFIDDPAVDAAMKWLRTHYREEGVLNHHRDFFGSISYEDAAVLCAIEAYYISAQEARARGFSNPRNRFRRDENGERVPVTRWGTEELDAAREDSRRPRRNFALNRDDQRMAELAVKSLEARFRRAYGGGGWRYHAEGMGEDRPRIDISATQYALLGLRTATRLGVRYDRSILFEVYELLRNHQDSEGPQLKDARPDALEAARKAEAERAAGDRRSAARRYMPKETDRARGWSYCRHDPDHPTDLQTFGGMTAAGVCALVLLRDELTSDRALSRRWAQVGGDCGRMIADGLAWLIVNWTMTENPRRARFRFYYYLYTMERLAMLGDLDHIAGRDWFVEGAQTLLNEQKPDGRWQTDREIKPSEIYDTCYALLFLKRTTEPLERPQPVYTGPEDR